MIPKKKMAFQHVSNSPSPLSHHPPRLPREGPQRRPVEALVGAAGPVQRRWRALDAAAPAPGPGVPEALGGVLEGPALFRNREWGWVERFLRRKRGNPCVGSHSLNI